MLKRCDGCRKSACDCGKFDTAVEVLGFDAKVHYTRPADSADILEALSTPGYAVRGGAAAWSVIQEAMIESNQSFDVPLKFRMGKFLAGPVHVSPEHEMDFLKRLAVANGGILVI